MFKMEILTGFTSVGPSIWEWTPIASTAEPSSTTNTDPSHILLMAWTGAQIRPLDSYRREYSKLFPRSRIIVVFTSPWDFCFRRSGRKRESLISLVQHLRYYEQLAPLRLLVHAFSEGGSNKATLLAEAYHSHTHGCRLPLDALCLDSTPGHPSFQRLRNGLNTSLQRQPFLKDVGMIIGTVVIAGKFTYYSLFSDFNNNPISRTRRQLLSSTYIDPGAPRCYLYSKSDSIVAWEEIKQHMLTSTDEDIPVTEVMFEGSEHCKHAREHPVRYWESVFQVWKKGTQIRACGLPEKVFRKEASVEDKELL